MISISKEANKNYLAKIIELWRDLGLTCFQVAEGNF